MGPSGFVRGFLIAFKDPKNFEQPTSPRLRRPGKHAEPAKAPCGVLAAYLCVNYQNGSSGISVGFFIGRNCEGLVLFPLPLRERARVRGFQ
jgi:hypothetical protein